MKKLFLLLILIQIPLAAQGIRFGEAKGLFMSVGVGPKIPIGKFADRYNLGVGFDVTFSYTDNELLPVFFYSSLGFQHFPGRQNFYKKSDYSSISNNVIVYNAGARYYFSPLIENIVLLMPVIEGGFSFSYFETSHQFKLDRGKDDYVEQVGKIGFHIGAGVSMFMLDAVTRYNYLPDKQYISFDLRVRIPIFVTI